MDLGIKGKRALVTGGSRGLGRQSALALANEGVDVAICARGKERLDATVGRSRRHRSQCGGIRARHG